MIARLPLEIDGRPVRIRYIEQLAAGNRPDKKARSRYNNRVWNTIMSKKYDGEWYGILPTAELEEREIARLSLQMKKKKYIKGYDTDVLTIRATRDDGICFSWNHQSDIMRPVTEKIAASRARNRKAQKAQVARIKYNATNPRHQHSPKSPLGEESAFEPQL